MLKMNQILDEKNPILRKKNEDVILPFSDVEKKTIEEMLDYLYKSQLEDIAKKYNLRPGMGLAGPQVGINKRFFVICHEEKPNQFRDYIIVNPKIISHSEEMIYAGTGEGCLSVNREVEGIVPRYARVTISYQDLDGNEKKQRAREELAIAFQHEMDHLDGILFTDRIDPSNPYANIENMREI